MANNRMYIYHPRSKTAFYLGRSCGEEWYAGTLGALLCEHLANNLTNFFYDTARIETPDDYQYGDRSYKIIYEDSDDFPENITFYDINSPCEDCKQKEETK